MTDTFNCEYKIPGETPCLNTAVLVAWAHSDPANSAYVCEEHGKILSNDIPTLKGKVLPTTVFTRGPTIEYTIKTVNGGFLINGETFIPNGTGFSMTSKGEIIDVESIAEVIDRLNADATDDCDFPTGLMVRNNGPLFELGVEMMNFHCDYPNGITEGKREDWSDVAA